MDDLVLVCLMVRNISLGPETRLALVNAVKRLAKSGKDRLVLKEKRAEIDIRTKWETACVGSFSGFKFEANVETDLGTGKVLFIMDEQELVSDTVYDSKNSFWMDDISSRAKNACLN